MKAKKKVINRVLAALCFTMALVLLLSGLGATLARYIRQNNLVEGKVVPTPFYFSSDKLGENNPYWQIPEPVGEESVEIAFTLSNFSEDGSRTTQTIQYLCWTGERIEGEEQLGTLEPGDPEDENQPVPVTVTVPKSAFGEDGNGTVTVTVQSTSPYAKTLSAEFGFNVRENQVQWNVKEEEGAVVLEIAGGSGSPVTVTWPSTLLKDPMNELLEDASGSSATFTAEPGVRYALTFLKEDTKTYSKEDFTVTE